MTVGGLGERAGNAALEEVAAALECLRGAATDIDLPQLEDLAALVAEATRRDIPAGKAIIGRDVFAHEFGIHVAGLLADPESYRGPDPALFGRHHSIVIGKHSGAKALAHALAQCGIALSAQATPSLVTLVRWRAMRIKRAITREELLRLHEEARADAEQRLVET